MRKTALATTLTAATVLALAPAAHAQTRTPELVSVDENNNGVAHDAVQGQLGLTWHIASWAHVSNDVGGEASEVWTSDADFGLFRSFRSAPGRSLEYHLVPDGSYKLAVSTNDPSGDGPATLGLQSIHQEDEYTEFGNDDFVRITDPTAANAHTVVFRGTRADTGRTSIYVWDVDSGTAKKIGTGTDPMISANAEKVIYRKNKTVEAKTLATGEVEQIAVTDDGDPQTAWPVDVSENGDHVLFRSTSTELAPDTQACADGGCLFRRSISTGKTVLASRLPDGSAAATRGNHGALTADGQTVAFIHSGGDAYARQLGTSKTERVNETAEGEPSDAAVETVAIDDDGDRVAFGARATNFGVDNPDRRQWLWLKELQRSQEPSRRAPIDGEQLRPLAEPVRG